MAKAYLEQEISELGMIIDAFYVQLEQALVSASERKFKIRVIQ
jgi:hypothetical protein